MRLIDADDMLNMVDLLNDRAYSKREIAAMINTRSTAYDIDKVVEELEHYKSQYEKISLSINDEVERRIYIAKDATMYNAIEIVKQGVRQK